MKWSSRRGLDRLFLHLRIQVLYALMPIAAAIITKNSQRLNQRRRLPAAANSSPNCDPPRFSSDSVALSRWAARAG